MTTVVNFIAAVLTGVLLIGGLTVLLGTVLQTSPATRRRSKAR